MQTRKEKNGQGKSYIVDKVFIDTNILVYTVDKFDKNKQEIARKIVKEAIFNDAAVISTQISFWDALLIAASESANCTGLITEDLNDGQIINGVKIKNPFNSM